MKEFATFAAGCFWGVEAAFRKVKGVKDVTAGYTGGHTENPSYEEVCSGETGHAEAVLVEYDPGEVSYDDSSQEKKARQAKEELERSGMFRRPIVTEIAPASSFYRAEEYHQRYYEKHGIESCAL